MKSFLHSLFATAGLALPAFAVQVPFDVPTASSDDVKTVYGVDIFKNSMSTVNLSVDTGSVLQAQIVYKSDTAHLLTPAGTSMLRGYTANVGILIPLNAAWRIHDLSKFDSLTFEFAANARINKELTVSFGSPKFIDSLALAGLTYEATKVRKPQPDSVLEVILNSAHDWFKVSYTRQQFAQPTWLGTALSGNPTRWAEPIAAFPSLDTVLANVKNIQISPKTSYTANAWDFTSNVPCQGCLVANNYVPVLNFRLRNINIWLNGSANPMKLGVGNGLEIGVRNPAKGTSYLGLSWNRGQLRLEDASQWSRVQILSLDGKAIASLKPASSQGLELANGTYFANLTDLQGRTLSQSFQVLH